MRVKVVHTSLDWSVLLAGKSRSGHDNNSCRKRERKVEYQAALPQISVTHHTQCSNANAIDCSLTKEHLQAVHLSRSPKRRVNTLLSVSTFIYERMLMYVACTHASLVRSPHPPLKTTNYASCRIPEWSLKQQIVCRTLRMPG